MTNGILPSLFRDPSERIDPIFLRSGTVSSMTRRLVPLKVNSQVGHGCAEKYIGGRPMLVRVEVPADYQATGEVNRQAFEKDAESRLVDALREELRTGRKAKHSP